MQKQSPGGILKDIPKKIVLKNCSSESLSLSFPVNFVKFLKTSVLQNTKQWLLLQISFDNKANLDGPTKMN